MKSQIVRFMVMAAAASFLATGCVSHRVVATPTGEVVVTTAPPPPRHEVITAAPGAGQVWVSGYWAHHHGRYVWVPGNWEMRPRPTAVWVQGHWDRTVSGWVWTPGHWE